MPDMRFLELRIPPPVVGGIFGAGMWALSRSAPALEWSPSARLTAALLLAAIGAVITLGGVLSFRRARTTVNPLKPETSATLVSAGVYSFTRNPMYLGMAVVLLAWAVWLACPWTLVGPMLFALYITRFQIIPEERVLARLFGAAFDDYRAKVRRWL